LVSRSPAELCTHWSVTVFEQRGYSACAVGGGAAAIGAITGAGGGAGIAGSAGAAGISPVGGVSGAGIAGGAGSGGGVACAIAAPLIIRAAVKASIFIARLLALSAHMRRQKNNAKDAERVLGS
jgi:hypothetical protein